MTCSSCSSMTGSQASSRVVPPLGMVTPGRLSARPLRLRATTDLSDSSFYDLARFVTSLLPRNFRFDFAASGLDPSLIEALALELLNGTHSIPTPTPTELRALQDAVSAGAFGSASSLADMLRSVASSLGVNAHNHEGSALCTPPERGCRDAGCKWRSRPKELYFCECVNNGYTCPCVCTDWKRLLLDIAWWTLVVLLALIIAYLAGGALMPLLRFVASRWPEFYEVLKRWAGGLGNPG